MKALTIIDKDYTRWVEALGARYRQSQIKAAVKVNREMLRFYWELGRDMEEMHVEGRWGESVIKNLSADLQRQIPNASGLSRSNIYYAKKFYLLYAPYLKIVPQLVGQIEDKVVPQVVAQPSAIAPQVVEELAKLARTRTVVGSRTDRGRWPRLLTIAGTPTLHGPQSSRIETLQ